MGVRRMIRSSWTGTPAEFRTGTEIPRLRPSKMKQTGPWMKKGSQGGKNAIRHRLIRMGPSLLNL